jgi:hypothetical protein
MEALQRINEEVKLSLYIINHFTMKTCGEIEVWLHEFLNSVVDEAEY